MGSRRSARAAGRGLKHSARAGLALIALATLALAVYALRWHTVGDTAAETDFYSGYVLGARALQHGHLDFGRYGVFGPVYEVLLALAGFAVRDLFTAARLLSVLALGATLFAWWAIARRRIDATAALALVALLAVDPTIMRYGYSATTDATALAFFSLSAWALFAAPTRGRLLLAGALAGLATLTRYNLATLLPAGALWLALDDTRTGRERVRAAGEFLGGGVLVLLPWTLASLAAGHVPGSTLLRDRGYYGAADPAAVLENRYRDIEAGIGTQPAASPGRALAALLAALPRGILVHLKSDVTELLGLPSALLAALGLIAALLRRQLRVLLPFVPLFAFTFMPLAPVYYAVRYSMVLLPLYLMPAAWLVTTLAHAPMPRPARLPLAWTLLLLVLVPTAWWSAGLHAEWRARLPLETRVAGDAIRAQVRPGERMIARKAHAAYYARLEPVPFPLVANLETLAGFCRARQASLLYYSGIEAEARPAFAYLLDTSVTVPGLTLLHAGASPPRVVYRIGPGFGATPAWWADEATRQRVAARVNTLLRPGPEARALYLLLAESGLQRGRPAEALRDAEAAARLGPAQADARVLEAEALHQLGHRDAAIETLQVALSMAPDDAAARFGLGLLLRESGRLLEAADAWQPLRGQTNDPHVLNALAELDAALKQVAAPRRRPRRKRRARML